MDGDEETLGDAPPLLLYTFERNESPHDWVDFSSFIPGIRMFHRNSRLVLGAFAWSILVAGFATRESGA